ncbi:hypothetical protein N0V95_009493 [Ascochyta clinopodiicola]|nr:hypothetical protein N0V95_009493 [Ascochyta clinopodiicola]
MELDEGCNVNYILQLKQDEIHRRIWMCLKAFVFGDRFFAHDFQRAAHQKFEEVLFDYPIWQVDGGAMIRYAYDNVPSHHPLLQYIADVYRHKMCFWEAERKSVGLEDDEEDWASQFSISDQRSLPFDLLLRVNKGVQQHGFDLETKPLEPFTWMEEHCYFEHASDNEKKKCGKLHVEYDEYMGYGFYEKKGVDKEK